MKMKVTRKITEITSAIAYSNCAFEVAGFERETCGFCMAKKNFPHGSVHMDVDERSAAARHRSTWPVYKVNEVRAMSNLMLLRLNGLQNHELRPIGGEMV
jgi:hypothetical protein